MIFGQSLLTPGSRYFLGEPGTNIAQNNLLATEMPDGKQGAQFRKQFSLVNCALAFLHSTRTRSRKEKKPGSNLPSLPRLLK